jgi:hypothetical protein
MDQGHTGYVHGACVVAVLLVSQWVLDYITHRPGLPVAVGTAKVGLGLWNSVSSTIVVEIAIFAAGVCRGRGPGTAPAGSHSGASSRSWSSSTS